MGLFACFAAPRVLDDDYSSPTKIAEHSQLHELYAGKLQHQRSLETPQGGIKAGRPATPASAPADLVPALQRCRPSSLTLAQCGAGEPYEPAPCEDAYSQGCDVGQLTASALAACDSAGEEERLCRGEHAEGADPHAMGMARGGSGGDLDLVRTCSPSDYSFSELLTVGEGPAPRRGSSGARRSLKFAMEPSSARDLFDSRDSDMYGSVTFPTVWREDDAEDCEAEAEDGCGRHMASATQQALQAVMEEGFAEVEAALAYTGAAAHETHPGDAPATVLLPPAPAPGCGSGAHRATASEVDERGRTSVRTLPRLAAFPYLAPEGAACESLVLLPPVGTCARVLRRAICDAGVALPGTCSLVLEAFPRVKTPRSPRSPRSPVLAPPDDAGQVRHTRTSSGAGDEWGAWDALCDRCFKP